jgi:hypothetical protein
MVVMAGKVVRLPMPMVAIQLESVGQKNDTWRAKVAQSAMVEVAYTDWEKWARVGYGLVLVGTLVWEELALAGLVVAIGVGSLRCQSLPVFGERVPVRIIWPLHCMMMVVVFKWVLQQCLQSWLIDMSKPKASVGRWVQASGRRDWNWSPGGVTWLHDVTVGYTDEYAGACNMFVGVGDVGGVMKWPVQPVLAMAMVVRGGYWEASGEVLVGFYQTTLV